MTSICSTELLTRYRSGSSLVQQSRTAKRQRRHQRTLVPFTNKRLFATVVSAREMRNRFMGKGPRGITYRSLFMLSRVVIASTTVVTCQETVEDTIE